MTGSLFNSKLEGSRGLPVAPLVIVSTKANTYPPRVPV